MSRATGCADDPAMLLKVKDAFDSNNKKSALLLRRSLPLLLQKHASKGCLFGVYAMQAVQCQRRPTWPYVLVA